MQTIQWLWNGCTVLLAAATPIVNANSMETNASFVENKFTRLLKSCKRIEKKSGLSQYGVHASVISKTYRP